MTIEIDTWFPTVIGKASCPFFMNIKNKYIKYLESKDISSSGFCYYSIHKDDKLKKLNTWIAKQVNELAIKFNFPDKYEAKESWFIDCKKLNAQPWHVHNGFIFSVIFYLEGIPDDSGTKFRSPYNIDMKNPYNSSPDKDHKADMFNKYTYPSCTYPCIPGKLLIFRSFVEHCTDLKITDNRRIVLIYNFDKI